ncbi:MAG: GYF domain-containing protein [Bdellovibrionales bacterium]
MKKYKVSQQGQEQGPFALSEIVAKIRAKELELFDYVFDEGQQDWILLMEHAETTAALKSNKPARPAATTTTTTEPKAEAKTETAELPPTIPTKSKKTTGSPHDIHEWFVLKGDHRFGPFEYAEIIRMLQQKVVYPFDFIWHAGLADWTRLTELPEFSTTSVKTLFENGGKKSELFVPRRFKRRQYSGRVIIHDNLTLWKGLGYEISKGGVGITMKNSLVIPGQQVFVHFSAADGWPTFNAVCEVVSKKYVNDTTPIQYGLRFISLSQETQEEFNKRIS